MINSELADLYIKQSELAKETQIINGKINEIYKTMSIEDIIETKASVTKESRMPQWIKKFYKKYITSKSLTKARRDGVVLEGYTAVYGLFADDELVYIGITDNLKRRITEHKRSDKVFDSHIVFGCYPNRYHAMAKEHHLVEAHKPLYNKDSLI